MARYIDADKLETDVRADTSYICVGDKQTTIQHIISATTEEVRPVVRGKWVEVDDYPHEEYECSVCGRIVEVTSANIKPEEEYPYCHCGADMREVEE
jgi:hypothetical protein